jgi:hypothetical protein
MQYFDRISGAAEASTCDSEAGDATAVAPFAPRTFNIGIDPTGSMSRSDAVRRRMLLMVDALNRGKAAPGTSETTEST